MAVPVSVLYVDIPGKGTARVYIEIFGDQFDEMSNVYEQVDWKPVGATAFDTMDEQPYVALMGNTIDSAGAYLHRILIDSGVTGYPGLDSSGRIQANREIVEWVLKKPKAEVDAMIKKWVVEKLYPALSKWLTVILKPMLTGVADTSGNYQNVEALLNAQIVRAKVTIVDGEIKITAA